MENGCMDNWKMVSALGEVEFATTPVFLEGGEVFALLPWVEREVNLNPCPPIFYGGVCVVWRKFLALEKEIFSIQVFSLHFGVPFPN